MRVLDLFSGIGGFSLGLERAGMETVAFCEWDATARKVLKKHWPDVPCHHDVKQLGYIRNEEPDDCILYDMESDHEIIRGTIDLICGGYPCQPFSTAGQRKGEDDDRHLWPEVRRLVQAIRPTWVLCENVAGHISMGLDNVLADLEALNYASQPLVIPACAVGAHHRRDRVWIIAHANELANGEQYHDEAKRHYSERSLFDVANAGSRRLSEPSAREVQQQRRAETVSASEDVAHANGRGSQGQGLHEKPSSPASSANRQATGTEHGSESRVWSVEPPVGRVVDGVSTELDATRRRLTHEESNNEKAVAEIDQFRREVLRAMWSDENASASSHGLFRFYSGAHSLPGMSHEGTYEGWVMGSRIKGDKGLHRLWDAICAQPLEETQDLQQDLLERIRQKECSQKVGQGRRDRLKQLGNAVVPQVVEVIGHAIMASR